MRMSMWTRAGIATTMRIEACVGLATTTTTANTVDMCAGGRERRRLHQASRRRPSADPPATARAPAWCRAGEAMLSVGRLKYFLLEGAC